MSKAKSRVQSKDREIKKTHSKHKGQGKVLVRLLKMLFQSYPVLLPLSLFCVLVSSVISAIPAIFQQKVLTLIGQYVSRQEFSWDLAKTEILPLIGILIGLYIFSICLMTLQTQIMPTISQGFLHKVRCQLFNGMQDLPLSYFDSHKHGEIMSHFTNDIDTIRQLVQEVLPNLIRCGIILVSILAIMIWYSISMTLIILVGIILMIGVSRKIAGNAGKYFIRQQESMAKTEGFIQEMMNGQKVIKVFSHEDQAKEDFARLNRQLCQDAFLGNAYANSLGPIILNIGNVIYVLVASLGGLFLLSDLPNPSLSGLAFSLSILVPFLNMTKQFTGNLNQLSQQANTVVMALAGARRVFDLMDEKAELDEGTISLVQANFEKSGKITESKEYSGCWAWKQVSESGQVTYTPLQGDMRMVDVDFSYVPGKQILHKISVYAEPGQKVAFVGSTGAGKTTITNLLNRFYEINDGQIILDGIDTRTIHKKDLRRSLGIVLQETNLFTGSVYDNIRYGKLDATDEECEAAARLVGANSFIERLPEGYKTSLANNGSNLSQGQRQLIAIARTAVADPPILILDEATSSIDTRTEAMVQRGMDMLMTGRTVFVIAHRLSTIRNSDVIMVMENGRIIERGSHDDLIKQGGTYYQLYSGAFELE